MQTIIKVGMAELNIIQEPGILTTLGLGSCVGIILYDRVIKTGGLVHIMLPSSKQVKNNENKAKFADTGIQLLFNKMLERGCLKSRIIAKIAGGSQMFSFQSDNDMMKIGKRNVLATKEVLSFLRIPITSEDTGGNYGRTIEFHTTSGKLIIKTIGHGVHEI
ncbi:MAG TPA: chemotaxis protein CheD [Oscillospiraceae bacterium]|nr:chemotaxis protein CheD [Oscillospiraceae bacterium]